MWVVLWPKVCATLRPPHLPFCSLPGNILFPAWEHFVPWAGNQDRVRCCCVTVSIGNIISMAFCSQFLWKCQQGRVMTKRAPSV